MKHTKPESHDLTQGNTEQSETLEARQRKRKGQKSLMRISDWTNKHMVISWGVISILYAVAIHFLFHWESGIKLIEAKWSAGEILTYGSTVALGLLAMWQNQRFKKENDAAQARLENLTQQANELTVISKIVEVELAKLNVLKECIDSFSEACNPITIVSDSDNPVDNSKVKELENRYAIAYYSLIESFRSLFQELHLDPDAEVKTTCGFVIKFEFSHF